MNQDNLNLYKSLQYKLLYYLHCLGFSKKSTIKISENIEREYYTPNCPTGVYYDVYKMSLDYPKIFNLSKATIKKRYLRLEKGV